ncbi:MAG: D-amino acid aminotransferase [Gammaproteobacteria bacterium]
MNRPICYLNGEYLPLEEARVSVLDRGFLFGDGVYEVIPVYGGHLFRLEEHLDRLDRSLELIHLDNPLDHAAWGALLNELISRNRSDGDQSVYLQVTRGSAPKRDHNFPESVTPTLFAMANPLPSPDFKTLERGIHAATVEDVRWQYCHIKAITLLPNVLLKQAAREQGADEAILIRDGYATEGSASNIFVVADGRLITPPKSNLLLPGITRDLVVELARQNDIPLLEQNIPETQLRSAEEIWVTSSTREVMPVVRLDDQPVGSGGAGEWWRRMHAIYSDYKAAVSRGDRH